jgi:hypothetical protein
LPHFLLIYYARYTPLGTQNLKISCLWMLGVINADHVATCQPLLHLAAVPPPSPSRPARRPHPATRMAVRGKRRKRPVNNIHSPTACTTHPFTITLPISACQNLERRWSCVLVQSDFFLARTRMLVGMATQVVAGTMDMPDQYCQQQLTRCNMSQYVTMRQNTSHYVATWWNMAEHRVGRRCATRLHRRHGRIRGCVQNMFQLHTICRASLSVCIANPPLLPD